MFYSASTNGFYTPEINGENMPLDVVEITAEKHAELLAAQSAGRVITADAEGWPITITMPVVTQPPPTSVTMRQARLALLAAGKYAAVQEAIAGASEAVRIDWEFAATIDRESPTVAQLAYILNLTADDLDGLFTAAAKL